MVPKRDIFPGRHRVDVILRALIHAIENGDIDDDVEFPCWVLAQCGPPDPEIGDHF